MWNTLAPPISIGVSDTNGSLAQTVGQEYFFRGGTSSTGAPVTLRGYRMVYNNSGTTLAAGAALIEQMINGIGNGNVTTTVIANDPSYAGHVPSEFGSATVAAASYFLMQISGPGKGQFSNTAATLVAPTTDTACGMLGTATTAGYVQLLNKTATGTATATINDIGALIQATMGFTTQSAAVTAAGQLGTIDLRIRR